MVQSGRLQPARLITHRFALDDIMEAYDTFGSAAKQRALKVASPERSGSEREHVAAVGPDRRDGRSTRADAPPIQLRATRRLAATRSGGRLTITDGR